jgi:uncharacterized repeat protein (TIGR01451 family)
VASQDVDTNLANNSAAITYFVNGENLAIGMTSSSAALDVGQTITYAINVTNFGLSYSALVTVSNTFSPNLEPLSATQSQGTDTIGSNQVVFNLGVLGVGQTASMTVLAVAVSGAPSANQHRFGLQHRLQHQCGPHATAQAAATISPAQAMITNLVVTAMASSAFIVWDTAAAATAQVQYGATSNYGSFSAVSATPATRHAVLLTGLTQGTDYAFEAFSWVGSTLYLTNGTFSVTNTLILNTQDAIYSGLWTKGTVATGIYGSYYQFSTTTVYNPTSAALYDPYIPASGLYNVFIWHPQNATFTTNAQVFVNGATNDFTLSINETTNGGVWQPLATNMYFASGANGGVIMYNDTGDTNKYLVANAMMWVYIAAQDYPTNGSVPAWWANFYFGTNVNGSVSGSADPDGDGYSGDPRPTTFSPFSPGARKATAPSAPWPTDCVDSFVRRHRRRPARPRTAGRGNSLRPSVWADVVKGRTNQTEEMLQFKAANPNHSVSHYTDIPFEEPKYRDDSIGATNVDVVHAIPACILILQGKPEAQSVFKDVTPRVALRLLAHFIEDIHQPSARRRGLPGQDQIRRSQRLPGHYGDDQGGNRLLFGGTNSFQLHYYWDTRSCGRTWPGARRNAPAIRQVSAGQKPAPNWKTSGPLLDWDRAWANESLALSAKVHDVTVTDEDDSQTDFRTGKPRPQWHIQDLSPEYIAWSDKAAEEQMIKAGYRLAATLEALWPDKIAGLIVG